VAFLVHTLELVTSDTSSDVLGKLSSICFLVIFLKLLHVFSNITAKDVLGVGLSIKAFSLGVVSRESLGGVGDIKSAIDGALERAEDLVSGGCSGETGVEEASEWSGAFFRGFYVVLVTINLGLTDVKLVKLHLGEKSSGKEKSGAVVSGVVLEADLDAVLGELVAVSCADHNITSHSRVDNLCDNISVGSPDYQSVLGGVKLVLVLSAKSPSGLVIGLSVLSSLELGLVSLKVSLVLLDLDQPVGSLFSSIFIFSGHFS